MKTLLSTILILSILSFQLSEMLIYFSFKINQETIAKNLCVEKDVEGSSCKGCCQLKKKLEHQQEQKQQVPTTENGKQNLTFFSENDTNSNYFFTANQTIKPKSVPNFDSQYIQSIFHPPKFFFYLFCRRL